MTKLQRPASLRARRLGVALALAAVVATPALAPAQSPVAPSPSAPSRLPQLGDSSEITSNAERKLGERIARELYRDPDYIDDPVIGDYVQGIWRPLLAAARARGELNEELDERFAWEILLGKDRTVNAFALPGGWMGLHLGLVAITTSKDELASVLAHELSHVTQRHIARLMAQEGRQLPWLMAAMILGALVVGKNADAANAIVAGGQAVAVQNQLNFSRDMEREADRVGYGVMTQAGFAPQGFVSMFDKLQQASRHNDNGSFPYLRTHPLTTERIADMQARQQLESRGGPTAVTSIEHAMMAARARVLSNPGVDSLRALAAEGDMAALASQPRARQAGALYAAALANLKLREAATANRLAGRLATLVADDPEGARWARLLSMEVALEGGDPARALSLAGTPTGDRPALLLVSQARTLLGQAARAASDLQTWVALHPRDATAWQQLATAYTSLGQPLRAIRAEAEAQAAHLDYAAALDRLRAAQDLARRGQGGTDYIEASIIDTRARQVESLLREKTLER